MNPKTRNENDQLKNDLSLKAIQVEDMLQQTQQADTQKDLQLNEKVAQNAQLQQKIEVLQNQMRNRGKLFLHQISKKSPLRFDFVFKMISKRIFGSKLNRWAEKWKL